MKRDPTNDGGADTLVGDTMRLLTGSARIDGHFGEMMQCVVSTPSGLTRGLITLPCPLFKSMVQVELNDTGEFATEPAGMVKAIRAAKTALAHFGIKGMGATISIRSNIPAMIGAGSSTADVAGTIIATAVALERSLAERDVAFLTVDTERASDPLMHAPHEVRLFAQRSGVTIERLEGVLPALEIVGIVDGAGVSTDDHPPAAYSQQTIAEFGTMLDGFRSAVQTGNAWAVGAIMTRSAEINQAYLEKKGFASWLRLRNRYGAVGVSVSHSGSAVGFAFDGNDPLRTGRIRALMAELSSMGHDPLVRYEIGGAPLFWKVAA